MSPNDYLFTAATICQVYHVNREVNTATEAFPHDIFDPPSKPQLAFKRYSFEHLPSSSRKNMNKTVFLDGVKIAEWHHAYNDHIEIHRIALLPTSNAERLIFDALGMQDGYASYAAKEAIRRAFLVPKRDMQSPEVEVVEDIDILSEVMRADRSL
ncbi:MAG: hypothetical protein M1829_001491 [Trizodia sp. TS-e1964]|nr:MAG: hypothetical protein M1829_001491 [Trizodia sp. TS-e1964]